jgi:hypothetical protein
VPRISIHTLPPMIDELTAWLHAVSEVIETTEESWRK